MGRQAGACRGRHGEARGGSGRSYAARLDILTGEFAVAYTQADIDALKAALATGALEVEFGAGPDKQRVRYRSLAEMQTILDAMIVEISPEVAPARVSYIQHCRD
jgi:hypothetical protein